MPETGMWSGHVLLSVPDQLMIGPARQGQRPGRAGPGRARHGPVHGPASVLRTSTGPIHNWSEGPRAEGTRSEGPRAEGTRSEGPSTGGPRSEDR